MQVRLLPQQEEPFKALAKFNHRTPTAEIQMLVSEHLVENAEVVEQLSKAAHKPKKGPKK